LIASDFLAQTGHLTDAGVSMYIRLLCRAWLDGSIPSEYDDCQDAVTVVDLLPVGDAKERRRAWKSVIQLFALHPTLPGRLVSPMLEDYREWNAAYRAEQTRKSQLGAAGREAARQAARDAKERLTYEFMEHSTELSADISVEATAGVPRTILPSLSPSPTAVPRLRAQPKVRGAA
jgi:hypothetical protein